MSTNFDSVRRLPYLLEQPYQKYSPNIFDDSLTLHEQINMITEYVNTMGISFNELVDRWDDFVNWLNTGGMNQYVIDELKNMYADGRLGEIINRNVFDMKADQLNNVLYVKQLPVPYNNAKGDGITDDSQAFQDAVNILASSGGGKILMGFGTFVFKKSVKWLSKVSLQGIGYQSKIKMVGGLFSAIVNTDNPSTGEAGNSESAYLVDCNFTDFQIDGSGLTHLTQTADGKGIFILYMKRCNFERLYIHHTIGTGLGCDFLDQVSIDKCIIEKCGRNWTTGGVGQSGIGVGTNSNRKEALSITNCICIDNGNYGIFVETQNNPIESGSIRSEGANISHNFVYGNRLGIGNKGSGGVIIDGNKVFYNQFGVQFTEGSERDLLTNNRIENNSEQGVYISADYKGKLSINNNTISENKKGIELIGGGAILKDLDIMNNRLLDNQYAGLQSDRLIEGLIVKGNKIKGNAKADVAGMRQGVLINATVDGFEIKDNYFAPSVSQQVAMQFKAGITLKDGTISGNELSKYLVPSAIIKEGITETNVTVRNNSGIMEQISGKVTMLDYELYTQVTFAKEFDQAPSGIILNLDDGAQLVRVWATNITRFGFMARQDIKTGAVVSYTAFR